MTPRLAISQARIAALLAASDDDPFSPIEYPNDRPNVAPFVLSCEDSRDLLPTVDYPAAPPLKKPGKARKPRPAPQPSTPKRKRREGSFPSPSSPPAPARQK
jgi:hypothetical protein